MGRQNNEELHRDARGPRAQDQRRGTHLLGVPRDLSAADFEEIVEVFRILKRWRDEARGGRR